MEIFNKGKKDQNGYGIVVTKIDDGGESKEKRVLFIDKHDYEAGFTAEDLGKTMQFAIDPWRKKDFKALDDFIKKYS